MILKKFTFGGLVELNFYVLSAWKNWIYTGFFCFLFFSFQGNFSVMKHQSCSFTFDSAANATLRASAMPSMQSVIFKASQQVGFFINSFMLILIWMKLIYSQLEECLILRQMCSPGQCSRIWFHICVWKLDPLLQQNQPNAWNHSKVMYSLKHVISTFWWVF